MALADQQRPQVADVAAKAASESLQNHLQPGGGCTGIRCRVRGLQAPARQEALHAAHVCNGCPAHHIPCSLPIVTLRMGASPSGIPEGLTQEHAIKQLSDFVKSEPVLYLGHVHPHTPCCQLRCLWVRACLMWRNRASRCRDCTRRAKSGAGPCGRASASASRAASLST